MNEKMPIEESNRCRDWQISADGQPTQYLIQPDCESLDKRPYRLYRFLTDVEDALEQGHSLATLRHLVRRLLNSCEWLQLAYSPPDPKTGWAVNMLYDEPDFPLTVQMVVWQPGRSSPIHNHGTWGVVAVLAGQEHNTFWRRTPQPGAPHQIIKTETCVLSPGDIISFEPEAIHAIQTLENEPTITFNLYGATQYDQRFRFHPETATATNF